jgi:hypothetical protein
MMKAIRKHYARGTLRYFRRVKRVWGLISYAAETVMDVNKETPLQGTLEHWVIESERLLAHVEAGNPISTFEQDFEGLAERTGMDPDTLEAVKEYNEAMKGAEGGIKGMMLEELKDKLTAVKAWATA